LHSTARQKLKCVSHSSSCRRSPVFATNKTDIQDTAVVNVQLRSFHHLHVLSRPQCFEKLELRGNNREEGAHCDISISFPSLTTLDAAVFGCLGNIQVNLSLYLIISCEATSLAANNNYVH